MPHARSSIVAQPPPSGVLDDPADLHVLHPETHTPHRPPDDRSPRQRSHDTVQNSVPGAGAGKDQRASPPAAYHVYRYAPERSSESTQWSNPPYDGSETDQNSVRHPPRLHA